MARASLNTTLIIVASNFIMLTMMYYLFMAGGGGAGGTTSHSVGGDGSSTIPGRPTASRARKASLEAVPGMTTMDAPASAAVQPCPPCPAAPPPQPALPVPACVCDCQPTPCPACPEPRCPPPPPAAPAPAPAVPPTRPRRHALLALAKGLKLVDAYRFTRSAREAAPNADVIIFTDSASGDVAQVYRDFGATVVLYSEAELGAAAKYHPSSYRWILMDKWLRGLAPEQQYDLVMFSDSRDAVFQGDIFARIEQRHDTGANVFYATLEAKPRTIRECGWNRKWVSDCFGQGVLSQVGGQVISCSGTSVATWGAALEYTGLMRKEIEGNPCERNGVDQGMHNVFVHGRRLTGSETVILTNEEGPIATVQSMKQLHRDKYGRLLNRDGVPYAVVHQYDRSAALKRQYDRQFPLLSASEQRQRD